MNKQSFLLEIDKAMEAHNAWRARLAEAIRDGHLDASPHDISCDDKCMFGAWLYGPSLDEDTKSRKPYQVTRRLHAEFHVTAGEVARLAKEGKRGEAYALLDNDFALRSETLGRALAKWRGEVAKGT